MTSFLKAVCDVAKHNVLVLGGGAAGLAAAIAAAQCGAQVILLDKNQCLGKKLLATGNGRCNLDNVDSGNPKRYFTVSSYALERLLHTIDEADPAGWFSSLGLVTRTDETGRVYPYSNQAADVTALLLRWLQALDVKQRTGCNVTAIEENAGGYIVRFDGPDGPESLEAERVICALGGGAGPQFGTNGFGTALAGKCGGKIEPLYPCLVPLRCNAQHVQGLAGVRARGAVRLYAQGASRPMAYEEGEIQFTDYGLSGICVMQLSAYLAPGRGPKPAIVSLDLFPQIKADALESLFIRHAREMPGRQAEDFWLGLLNRKLGSALWQAANLPPKAVVDNTAAQCLARIAKDWRFTVTGPCGFEQAQTTGGGLALDDIEPGSFKLKGSKGLYFVGETLDCAGSCGGFNLHWAFGSGIAAGRAAAGAAVSNGKRPEKQAIHDRNAGKNKSLTKNTRKGNVSSTKTGSKGVKTRHKNK